MKSFAVLSLFWLTTVWSTAVAQPISLVISLTSRSGSMALVDSMLNRLSLIIYDLDDRARLKLY